jgi:hypothetical protein
MCETWELDPQHPMKQEITRFIMFYVATTDVLLDLIISENLAQSVFEANTVSQPRGRIKIIKRMKAKTSLRGERRCKIHDFLPLFPLHGVRTTDKTKLLP